MTCLVSMPSLMTFRATAAADRFLLFGHINHPAAPFAELLEKSVATDMVPGFFGEAERHALPYAGFRTLLGLCGELLQERACLMAGLKELFDSLPQRSVGATKLPPDRRHVRQPPAVGQ